MNNIIFLILVLTILVYIYSIIKTPVLRKNSSDKKELRHENVIEQYNNINDLDKNRQNVILNNRDSLNLGKRETLKYQWTNVDAYIVKTMSLENISYRNQSYVGVGFGTFGSKKTVYNNKKINGYSLEVFPLDTNGYLYETGHRLIYKGKAYNRSLYRQFITDSFYDDDHLLYIVSPKNGQTIYFDVSHAKFQKFNA